MAKKIIKKVLERKADGLRYVIIPRKSEILKEDYVEINKIE